MLWSFGRSGNELTPGKEKKPLTLGDSSVQCSYQRAQRRAIFYFLFLLCFSLLRFTAAGRVATFVIYEIRQQQYVRQCLPVCACSDHMFDGFRCHRVRYTLHYHVFVNFPCRVQNIGKLRTFDYDMFDLGLQVMCACCG